MPFPVEILLPGNPLTIADLTTKNVDGAGTFDVIMKSLHNHLKGEYESNRISGQEYTKAYIALTTAALSTAVQFLLQRDTAYFQKVLLQQQVDGLLLDNAIKNYNLENILPEQKTQLIRQNTGINTDNLTKDYTLSFILPLQKNLLQEQVEVQRAQTLDNRTDGGTITGAVGKQKELYSQQITSYRKDAEVKAAKLFVDAWITQKTIDEGLTAPNNFTNVSVDNVLAAIKASNSFP